MWGDECVRIQIGSEPAVTLLFIWEGPGVSTRVTTRERPKAEDGTVGEKCPANFA
jgi:hypothetical protein